MPPLEPARLWWSFKSSSAAARLHDEPARDLHERRLARSIRPEQADEFALPHLEIYPLERLHLPVALGQCLGGERSSHVASVGTALVPEEG